MANELETDYLVADGDIAIDVTIGQAQLGASLLKLDDRQLASGDVRQQAVGKGADLKGKVLFVKTIVSDVSDKTNLTSVRYGIRGGKADQSFDLSASVQNDGDSVIYRAWFNLK
jgi:hypothetical protein